MPRRNSKIRPNTIELPNIEVVGTPDLRSTLEARIRFWELVRSIRPAVFESLLAISLEAVAKLEGGKATPMDLLIAYLKSVSNELEIDVALIAESAATNSEFINREVSLSEALRKLVPAIKLLRRNQRAIPLTHALNDWGNEYSLSNRWCLDFGLDVLRQFAVELFDDLPIANDPQYDSGSILLDATRLKSISRNAIDIALKNLQIKVSAKDYGYLADLEDLGPFEFAGLTGVRIFSRRWIPTFHSASAFQDYAKGELRNYLKVNPTERNKGLAGKLDLEIKKYIRLVNRIYAEGTTPRFKKTEFEKNLRWFVETQVPPTRSQYQIHIDEGREEGGDGERWDLKTIRDGVNGMAKLLKFSKKTKTPGRPRGSRNSAKAVRSVT